MKNISRKTVLFILISVMCAFGLSASEQIILGMPPAAEGIEYYRYQVNGEQEDLWKVVDSQASIVLIDFDKAKDAVFIQQSADGELWSRSGRFEFDADSQAWVQVWPMLPSVEAPVKIP